MTIPDYLVKATEERYGPDAASLVKERIEKWETEKLPEDNSHLSTELYRLAYCWVQRDLHCIRKWRASNSGHQWHSHSRRDTRYRRNHQ